MDNEEPFPWGEAVVSWNPAYLSLHCPNWECLELVSTPPYIYIAFCFIKQEENFTNTLVFFLIPKL